MRGWDRTPLSGSLFLFVSRDRCRLKALYFDRDGLALWYKRLEEGTFRLPAIAAGPAERGTASQRAGDAAGGDRPEEPAAGQTL